MKQYAIMHNRQPGLHRGPYEDRSEAESWIQGWLEDGGRASVFYIVSREVTDWKLDKPD